MDFIDEGIACADQFSGSHAPVAAVSFRTESRQSFWSEMLGYEGPSGRFRASHDADRALACRTGYVQR
jgi:hypothetical protein